MADRFCRVSRCIFPFIQRVFADSGYAGEKVTATTLIAVEIVRKKPRSGRLTGVALMIEPHPASIQDRDGGGPLLQASRRLFPFIERVFADGGYAGERVATATRIIVEIVAKSPDQIGFAVLPPMGGRAVLCLDRPQQKACQRFRGQHRLRPGLPLRRFRHAALTPHRRHA